MPITKDNYQHLEVEIGLNSLTITKEHVIDEMIHYSITPTTIRKRQFSNIDHNLQLRSNKLNEQQDNIKNQLKEPKQKASLLPSSKVKNSESKSATTKEDAVIQTQNKLYDLEHQQKQLFTYMQQLNDQENKSNADSSNIVLDIYNAIFIDTYANNDGNSVQRYGIHTHKATNAALMYDTVDKIESDNASQSSSGTKKTKSSTASKKKVLHPLEIELLQQAIEYLEAKPENKLVLVDIFARGNDGHISEIKDAPDYQPETHTVVIYKNYNDSTLATDGAKEYLIIDPSSTKHSKHLEFNSYRIFNSDKAKFVAASREQNKDIQIYVAPREADTITDEKEEIIKLKTGPNVDQFRDCIDIAVKLAFSLQNYEDNQSIIKSDQFAALKEVQQISNQQSISPFLKQKPLYTSFRIQQASDNEVREQVNTVIKKTAVRATFIDDALKCFCTSEAKEKAEQFQENHLSMFDDCSFLQYESKTQNLVELYNNTNTNFVCEFIKADKIVLIGQVGE